MEGGSAPPPVSAAVRASLLSHPAERALNGEPGPIPSRQRHEASDAAPGAGRRRRAGGMGGARSPLSLLRSPGVLCCLSPCGPNAFSLSPGAAGMRPGMSGRSAAPTDSPRTLSRGGHAQGLRAHLPRSLGNLLSHASRAAPCRGAPWAQAERQCRGARPRQERLFPGKEPLGSCLSGITL